MSVSGAKWYVVRTHPKAEMRVVAHLRRQGFDTYLPSYRKLRSHAGRKDFVAAPLFPRYVFVAVDSSTQRWRSICSTFGVANLVCSGGIPSAVPARLVDDLRKTEKGDGFIAVASPWRQGEVVQVMHGAFASQCGIFDGMTDDARVTVLLHLLGNNVRLVLDASSVASAA